MKTILLSLLSIGALVAAEPAKPAEGDADTTVSS